MITFSLSAYKTDSSAAAPILVWLSFGKFVKSRVQTIEHVLRHSNCGIFTSLGEKCLAQTAAVAGPNQHLNAVVQAKRHDFSYSVSFQQIRPEIKKEN